MQLEVSPSFFEITWALALTHFIESGCSMCVIETGLGGKLDSTNIIMPVLSVITNVSLDHVAILGDSLEQIAFEKAGIIKRNTPVVIGETLPETLPVFISKAAETSSTLFLAEDFKPETDFIHPEGTYPWINERTVRTAVEVINDLGYHLEEPAISNGIRNTSKNTGFRGRFEVIAHDPLTIVDVAHNEDGIRKMLQTLKFYQKGKLHIIYGTSSDKDLESILSLFPADAQFYMTAFSNQRSARMEDLKANAEKLGLSALFFTNVQEAVGSAQLSADKSDTILITGSFFLVSDFF